MELKSALANSPAVSAERLSGWPASWVSRCLSSLRFAIGSVSIRRRERALKLCESLSLGERRLLALVECEGERLLLGVTNQSVTVVKQWSPRNPDHEKQSAASSGGAR